MPLPQVAIDFLKANAEANGAQPPGPHDDLFKLGALDSFALVDLITMLEEHYEIRIPDTDINQENFRTIKMTEDYIDSCRS